MRDKIIRFTNGLSVTAFALLVVWLPRTEAVAADPVAADTSKVWVSLITPEQVRGKPVWIVSWSDGVTKVLTPCKYEDGRRCYWEADKRGNTIGQTFLVSRGKVWKVGEYAN